MRNVVLGTHNPQGPHTVSYRQYSALWKKGPLSSVKEFQSLRFWAEIFVTYPVKKSFKRLCEIVNALYLVEQNYAN